MTAARNSWGKYFHFVLGRCVLFLILLLLVLSPHFLASPVLASSQQAILTGSDSQAADGLGSSISISGDTILIGTAAANNETGAAYVFTRNGSIWSQQAKLTGSDSTSGSRFGSAVFLSGDNAIVGENEAAYIFVRNGTNWTQQAKLTGSDSVSGDSFGVSVCLNGDTAIVGASTSGLMLFGTAYVFTRTGTNWTEQAKLTASDSQPQYYFGCSVAIEGDTAIVGATGSNSFKGAAYVFTRSGSSWSEQTKLIASGAGPSEQSGASVSISGTRVIVGVNTTSSVISAAYIFSGSGATWTQEARLTASDGAVGDAFGWSVGLSGDKAIVGAYDALSSQGAAYIFSASGTDWTQHSKLTAADGSAEDQFGTSVAIDGNTAVVGSPMTDPATGAGYVFDVTQPDVVSPPQGVGGEVKGIDRLGVLAPLVLFLAALAGAFALVRMRRSAP